MRAGLEAMQVYIIGDEIITGYNILLHKLEKLTKIYHTYNRKFLHRELALHLWNMGFTTQIGFEYIRSLRYRVWIYFHISINSIVYRIQSIKHIFSYNKQNKLGQMSLLIQKYI